jgi:hypothetical protein
VSPSHVVGAAPPGNSLPPVSPQPDASIVVASPPEAIQFTPSSVSHGGGHVRAGSGHVRVGSGSVTSGRSDGMEEDDVEGEANGSSARKGANLDPHTLEWVQKLKAETSEAERRRQEELLATLSPEELVRAPLLAFSLEPVIALFDLPSLVSAQN